MDIRLDRYFHRWAVLSTLEEPGRHTCKKTCSKTGKQDQLSKHARTHARACARAPIAASIANAHARTTPAAHTFMCHAHTHDNCRTHVYASSSLPVTSSRLTLDKVTLC
jgi:hypothetical protein